MAGVRQTLIKEDSKREAMESKIASFWGNVGDINLGQINMKKFQGPLYTTKPSEHLKMMIESEIVKAAGFPLAVQCNELIVECAKHYDASKRMIVAPDGRELSYLSERTISEAFHIPEFTAMIYKSKEKERAFYDDDPDKCLGIINKYWLLKSRPGLSKIPANLHKIYSKQEFNDLITMLN